MCSTISLTLIIHFFTYCIIRRYDQENVLVFEHYLLVRGLQEVIYIQIVSHACVVR